MPPGRSPRPQRSLPFRRLRALVLLAVLILVVAAAVRVGAGLAGPDDVPVAAAPLSPTERLRAAVRAADAGQRGRMSVVATDLESGTTTTYKPNRTFVTASIVKVDILAALLLQENGRLTRREKALARQMICSSSNSAASVLWRQIGRARGLAAANARLGLTSTVGGQGAYWGLTTTTATDQARLLTALFTARSPLNASSRKFVRSLMGRVVADQDWGIPAAATNPKAAYVKNGWLPRSGGWVVHSIGSVRQQGNRVLLVTLSDGRASKSAGIKVIEKVAPAAADAVAG